MTRKMTEDLPMFKSWYKQYSCTTLYIIFIVTINSIFVYAPYITINGSLISSGDIIVGMVYILRDFAQREIKHYVIVAMLIGCFFSYILADQAIAVASLSAFFVGEFIDWAIYTFTKKPLAQRLLWSSCVSAPVDSFIFLYLTQMLNTAGLIALTLGKFVGVLSVWYIWRTRSLQMNNNMVKCVSAFETSH